MSLSLSTPWISVSWFQLHCNLESCTISTMGRCPNSVSTHGNIVSSHYRKNALGVAFVSLSGLYSLSNLLFFDCTRQTLGPLLLYLDSTRSHLTCYIQLSKSAAPTVSSHHFFSCWGPRLNLWWMRKLHEIGLPYFEMPKSAQVPWLTKASILFFYTWFSGIKKNICNSSTYFKCQFAWGNNFPTVLSSFFSSSLGWGQSL